MQLPREGASPGVRVRYGRYVARRSRRAGHAELADALVSATTALKNTARAAEDIDELIEDALAARDAADAALDAAAQSARNALAGRGLRAIDEAPRPSRRLACARRTSTRNLRIGCLQRRRG